MNQTDFGKLDPAVKYIAFLVLGFTLFMVWDQYPYWNGNEDYSFGFIVPLFAGYVIYERWPRIKTFLFADQKEKHKFLNFLANMGAFSGLLVMLLAGLLRAGTGSYSSNSVLFVLGFIVFVLSSAFIFSQSLRFVGFFIFPTFIWLISVPMFPFVDVAIKTFLLGKVSVIVYNVFDFLGLTIEREGSVLVLPEGKVGVADACSGIRSLTASVFAGSFIASVFLDKLWKKALMVFMAMVLAFMTNVGRGLFLTGWAYMYGPGAIEGTVHDVAGYVVLGLTCLGLMTLVPLFCIRLEKDIEG